MLGSWDSRVCRFVSVQARFNLKSLGKRLWNLNICEINVVGRFDVSGSVRVEYSSNW